MKNNRTIFLDHIAQTSPEAQMLEIKCADGIYLEDVEGKKYMDLVSGVCVSSLGHGNDSVKNAIHNQVEKYMHTTVYGEHIQKPQLDFAQLLLKNIPGNFESIYYVNSGSEAVEGAIKLARRSTGKSEIIACYDSYHGSTIGAESLRSDIDLLQAYAPFVPGVRHINFNNIEDLSKITNRTAAVIVEPVKAEAGIWVPIDDYLKKLRVRCDETDTLLIFDEIQTGFGRTGSLFAFMKYNVIPDIFMIAKAMGGGMPCGAFISSKDIMKTFSESPALGHITTFGGHPVCIAAAHANLKFLLESNLISEVERKEKKFLNLIGKSKDVKVRSSGLLMAIDLSSKSRVQKTLQICLEIGIMLDFFLFYPEAFRIAPPLIISDEEIEIACEKLNYSISRS